MKKLFPFLTLILLWCMSTNVYAGVVHSYKSANPDAAVRTCSKKDWQAITAELNRTGSVELVSGETYYWRVIQMKSGWTIKANKAVIYCDGDVVNHKLSAANYNSLKNVKISGGIWKSLSSSGYKATSFHFIHAQNITLQNMDIRTSNYQGHTIELVACKNVTIKNCTIKPLGTPKATCAEEQIQIDVATLSTFPNFKKKGVQYANGAVCKDIKILNCTVQGGRAVCAIFPQNESKCRGKFHSNITIKNCKLTGLTSEALTLFNTSSATITGNTLISKAPLNRGTYSSGLHCYYVATTKSSSNGKINISKNTIKGGNYAVVMTSASSAKYGTIILEKNKMYSKVYKKNGSGGKSDVKFIDSKRKKLTEKGNKSYKW